MPISKIMNIPLCLSTAAILPAALSRYFKGRMLETAIQIKAIKTGSAKACASSAKLKWPFSSNTTAVVKPHPGHVTPKVERIGHCQPVNPVIVSASWATQTPVNTKMYHLSCSIGAITGVKNHFIYSNPVDLPDAAVFCLCPFAGFCHSALLVISTRNFMLRSA